MDSNEIFIDNTKKEKTSYIIRLEEVDWHHTFFGLIK